MRVLDIQDDLGAYLLAVHDNCELSDMVKTASWSEPLEGSDRDFALILVDTDGSRHRKYACHDRGNVLVSMLYLDHACSQMNTAASKTAAVVLSDLARAWGLDVPIEISKLAAAELTREDLRDVVDERTVRYRPPPEFSVREEPAGPFAKLAATARRWFDLTPQQRREVAVDLRKEAQYAPLSLPACVYQYAGEGLNPKFASYMRQRCDYTSDPEVAQGYDTLAKIASTCEPDSVVSAIYALDDLAHLRWAGGDRYGDVLADPVRCVYACEKTAAYSWNSGSDATSETELHEFVARPQAAARFLGTFKEEIWRKFQADPVDVFRAMPEHQKVLVSRMAREV